MQTVSSNFTFAILCALTNTPLLKKGSSQRKLGGLSRETRRLISRDNPPRLKPGRAGAAANLVRVGLVRDGGLGGLGLSGAVRREEGSHGLQRGLFRDRLRTEEDGELARVARSDAVHVRPVLRREIATRLDRLRHAGSVDGVAAHEALAVLLLGLAGALLPGRLERVEDHHRLHAEGGVRVETLADLGLGEEGVEVRGLVGFGRHDRALLCVAGMACPPSRTARTAGRW